MSPPGSGPAFSIRKQLLNFWGGAPPLLKGGAVFPPQRGPPPRFWRKSPLKRGPIFGGFFRALEGLFSRGGFLKGAFKKAFRGIFCPPPKLGFWDRLPSPPKGNLGTSQSFKEGLFLG